MKNTILLLAILVSQIIFAQGQNTLSKAKQDTIPKTDFFKRLKIGQSMETTDERGEPAQAVVTFPEDGTDSYLVNLGLLYTINPKRKLISKVKAEYHKNTLTDKEQDNIEVGYQTTWNLRKIDSNNYLFFIFDPKYVYNGVTINNAVASNVLFSWYKDNSQFNINTKNYIDKKKSIFYKPSLFIGTQLQHNFKSENEDLEGFIMRPLASASLSISLLRKKKEFMKYSILYTGREDVINNTKAEEGYTKLLKTGLEIFIPNNTLEVSLGVSYNKGSDPIKGLADQKYWLLSFNVHN
jgi:hypothetical protein